MSAPDEPIPKKFWGMVHWTLRNHPWIFFLIALERITERDFHLAAVFGGIFVANLFVVSRWDEIGGYLRSRKMLLPYLALGALGVFLVGIAIGAIWNTGFSPIAAPKQLGRISWNFEQAARGESYFLNMGRLNEGEIRIVGFGAHGKNTSNDPITQFKGHIRSNLTNAEMPIYIIAEDVNAPPNPILLQGSFMPTLPEETFGIPGLADFDIVTHNTVTIQTGVDGVPASRFLKEWGSFTLILEYDGTKFERLFSISEVKAQIALFEKNMNAQNATIPRVTRKPDAPPPPPSPIQLLPLQPPQQPATAPQQNAPPPAKETQSGKSN